MKNRLKLVVGIILMQWALYSYAYIDPGTGAYFIQACLAVITGIIFYLKHPVELIKSWLKKFKSWLSGK
jgi:hypothetical protein